MILCKICGLPTEGLPTTRVPVIRQGYNEIDYYRTSCRNKQEVEMKEDYAAMLRKQTNQRK